MPLYNLSWNCWSELLAGGILLDALFSIQGYFICLLLSNSALSDDSGMESRIVKRLHWQLDPLNIRLILISTRLDLLHTRLDLIHIRLDLIYTRPHCKDKMPKIWNKYSQKRTIAVWVPISTFMCLWANYIFPQWVFLFCWRKYVDLCWEYINPSQTHECGNWGRGRAVPRKGIHKRNCRCSADPIHTWLEFIHIQLDLIHTWLGRSPPQLS